MVVKINFFHFGLLFLGFAMPLLASESDPWSDLNATQQNQVMSGQQVFTMENVASNPWPQFTVYQWTPATPKQAIAVFWDCQLDPSYIPNCLSAAILHQPVPSVVEVTYQIHMPLLPNEIYIARNELHAESGAYVVSWQGIKSKYTNKSMGSLRAVPHGSGTLLRYRNLITPGSSVAVLLRGKAEHQVQQTVTAIVGQISHEMNNSSQLLAQQVLALETALEGKAPTSENSPKP